MSNKGFPAHEWLRRFAGRMEIDREQRSNLVSEFDQLKAIADEMAAKLEGLLADTQHAKHNCKDTDCPVLEAKNVLNSYQQLTNGETKCKQ